MVGRPPKYKTSEETQSKIDEYFIWIKGEKGLVVKSEDGKTEIQTWVRYPEPPTITGLALYLGFESRQSFYAYEDKPEFSYTIKRARTKIENEYEKKLSGNNVAGPIFALKNLGWRDVTETKLSGGLESYKPSWFIPEVTTITNGQEKES